MISKNKFKKLLPIYIDCAGSASIRERLKVLGCRDIDGLGERVIIGTDRVARVAGEPTMISHSGIRYIGGRELSEMMRELTKKELIAQKELKLSKAGEKVLKLTVEIEGLKKPEFEYPMFFEFIKTGEIVKFSAIKAGEIVKKGGGASSEDVGHKSTSFIEHTYPTKWKQVPHDKETGFYEGEIITCWDDGNILPSIRGWNNGQRGAYYSTNGGVVAWQNYAPLSELGSVLKKIAEQQKRRQ